MFGFSRKRRQATKKLTRAAFGIESLEGRTLFACGPGIAQSLDPATAPIYAQMLRVVDFNQTPSAVQSALTNLATTDGLAAPTADQDVQLNNVDGTLMYSIVYKETGKVVRLTVDQDGNAVTAPSRDQTTWAILNGSGEGSNAAAAAEISAIAAALGLEAPTDTTVVRILTKSSGEVVYSVTLAKADTNTDTAAKKPRHGAVISVDANGNPVGNQNLPFSVIPAVIQNGLNANAPSGATPLESTSTELVKVATLDGVTLYSYTFNASGTQTKVTVDSTGALATAPTKTTTTFAELSAVVQSALQSLATDAGATDTIDPAASVDVRTQANGTVLYTVSVKVTKTDANGNSFESTLRITVDSNGNVTVPPRPGGIGHAGPGAGNIGHGGPGGGKGGPGGGGKGPGGLKTSGGRF